MSHSDLVKTRLKLLLKDYGYEMQGNTLIEKAIRGFTSARVINRFRDVFDAAEYLRPVIADENFSNRLNKIGA
jgi:hypothetical protein